MLHYLLNLTNDDGTDSPAKTGNPENTIPDKSGKHVPVREEEAGKGNKNHVGSSKHRSSVTHLQAQLVKKVILLVTVTVFSSFQ